MPKKIRTRPETTLFLIMSVDGRITSHDSDDIDPNKTWKQHPRIRAITQQFFDFSLGDVHTITYGSALAKVGINTRSGSPKPLNVNLIVIDDQNSLTLNGIQYLAQSTKKLFLITHTTHTASKSQSLPKNTILYSYKGKIDYTDVMINLYKKHRIKNISIQSNATLNTHWLSLGLVDHLSVIITPLLVGKHGTPTLNDRDLLYVKPLIFKSVKTFGAGFINLRYDVVNTDPTQPLPPRTIPKDHI